MSQISDYYIVSRHTAKELENKVNDLIRCGYVPTGGVSVLPKSTFDIIYSQAMIRYKELGDEQQTP